MNKISKISFGMCIHGDEKYWALALVSIIAFLRHCKNPLYSVKIATDQSQKYETTISLIKKLNSLENVDFELVVPSVIYESIAPPLNKNWATYWKFDLFRSLKDDELLIYNDADAFMCSDYDFTNLADLFSSSHYILAAVHAQRPVLERVCLMQESHPFSYFNAGVLFGIKSSLYDSNQIQSAISEIIKWDPLKLVWHDQDLLNYLCKGKVFFLDPRFNLSTGFLRKEYRNPYLINSLLGSSFYNYPIFVHYSGAYCLNSKYHPLLNFLVEHLKFAINLFFRNKCGLSIESSVELNQIHSLLVSILDRISFSRYDYFLQNIYFRKKIFANEFYFSIYKLINKITRKVLK